MIVKVTKITQISIQKKVIDTENFLQLEDAIIVKHKKLEKIMISGDKKNPLDKSGNILHCAICQSIYHWANDWPNKVKEEQSSHVKITLFTKDIYKCYIEKFVGETLNCAVLDSGWTKNVYGMNG